MHFYNEEHAVKLVDIDDFTAVLLAIKVQCVSFVIYSAIQFTLVDPHK